MDPIERAAKAAWEAWYVASGIPIAPWNQWENAQNLRGREPWLAAIRAAQPILTETLDSHLANLLARIFRDGGHRQADIGDDARAVEEADGIVVALMTDNHELRQNAETLREALEFYADPEMSEVDFHLDSGKKARQAIQASAGGDISPQRQDDGTKDR